VDASIVRVASLAGTAWLTSLVCVALAVWHARRVRERASPGVDALVRELRDAGTAPGGVEFARSELSARQADAERALMLATLLPRSLARIALASGTALALLQLTAASPAGMMSAIVGALAAFAAGLFGSLASAWLGREARERARTARAEWKRHALEADRRLQREEEATQGVDRGETVGLRS
jgi:hypothetical protein